MEKTDKALVVPMDCGWSDVGSWAALREIDTTDASGNVLHGDVTAIDVANCYLRAESRLLTALGVSDLVVVETADAVLVAQGDRTQDVKMIVDQLASRAREEIRCHKIVYRPWGSYESLVQAPRFQVKRIVVNPGQQLSLQMHHHRAEHWVVVRGIAHVTCGDREFTLGEDASTYIPLATRHRLANPGVIPLELIEVQSGSYLGEDDIVRFEDVYGRTGTPRTVD
jgi:mannose-1-phosphate guanylyltransferase/mannose-6-phosphate isomerase